MEETIYVVEEDDEDEIVKVINATEALLGVRLTRDGRRSRSNQKCSSSGVSCSLSSMIQRLTGRTGDSVVLISPQAQS